MATTILDWLPHALRTTDALFPSGAYAHSLGMEEWVRLSGAQGEAGLADFLRMQALPALARQELPYLRFAYRAAVDGDLPELIALDREIDAWKIPAELRAASRGLGSRRLEALLETAPSPVLERLGAAIASGDTPGNHITITAAQYASAPLEVALATYLYQALSGCCVAALKLLRIGQRGCQRALTGALREAPSVVAESMTVRRGDAGWFNPLLEIASMRHESAYERLFIS